MLLGFGAVLAAVVGEAMAAKKRKVLRAPKERIESSLDVLEPAFRARVEILLERMRQRGFRPKVFETYRTPERAAELEQRGTGKANSLHAFNLAVDIIDELRAFKAPPAFWDALHAEALALGLGRVKHQTKTGALEWDLPHVQALPGRFDQQLRVMAPALRDGFLTARYQSA